MMDPTDALDMAVAAARAAALTAAERFSRPLHIAQKGFRDIVTDADVAAQDAAVSVIRARFPDAAVLGEENLAARAGAETVWVIDPIDGTTNYAQHIPFFCASVGVVQRGRPVAGAVCDPMHDHLFTAARGRGARLNGSPIRASDVQSVSQAVLAVDWGQSREARTRSLDEVARIAPECRTVRATGSATLCMCYLAAGWIDMWFNFELKPWDGAAGQVIVEEAGGRLTTPTGDAWNYDQPAALASNGHLHAVYDRNLKGESA